MTDIILALVIFAIVGSAIRYIYKSHKKGVKCIGCPAGCSCVYKGKSQASGGCGCNK